MSAALVEELHGLSYGAQDNAIDKWLEIQKDELAKATLNTQPPAVFKETRTFTYDVSDSSTATFRHVISHGYGYNSEEYAANARYKDEAYTNFKISPVDAIKGVELLIGGQRIENLHLFRFLETEPQFYQMSEGRYLPALSYHSNEIKVTSNYEENGYKGPITISYDVLTVPSTEKSSSIIIYQEEWTGGKEILSNDEMKMKLNIRFNHPLVKVYAFIDAENIKSVILTIYFHYNSENKAYMFPLIKADDKSYYYIEFGDKVSINFSRITEAYIQVEADSNIKNANVFGIAKQIVRRMNGMAGAAFSK